MRVRRRRRQTNPLVSAIIFFVLGVILAVVAITTDPNNVTCDGQTMSAGDECIHTENGVETSTNSIDEQRQSQQTGRIFEAVFAVLFLGAGIFSITRISKTRAALKNNVGYTATTQQPGTYPPPQGGYPQQPGNYPPPPNGYPQQPGTYPPPPNGYPQQPGAYPPPQGGYPQPNTPSQPGSYPPPPNNYPQQ